MPIKGLSDQVRLPSLGKIRLGLTVQGHASPYPRPVDYFVCPDSVRSVYGETPRELHILFPSEDPSQWVSQFYRCYSRSRGLICKGDGEKAAAVVDEDTGALATGDSLCTVLRELQCDPGRCPEYGRSCRRVMNLQFLLPDVPGLGVWQLDTSSYWSITNINSGIRLVAAIWGRVSMIPLILKLLPREVHPGRSKKTVYVLSLDIPGRVADIAAPAGRPAAEAVLPAPDADPPGDLFPPAVLGDTRHKEVSHGSQEQPAQVRPG